MMAKSSGTIGRFAFFFGIIAGVLVASIGLGILQRFELPGWASLGCEMLIVGISLALTTGIWRWSVIEEPEDATGSRP